ncbi:MAG: hypothetical protein NUV86_12675 [Candidatus Scalindua sp.]|nr:hypothetical protein [Candidatus Scalindua sp.]
MKQQPTWRTDNILPLLLLIGSFFVYLVRLSVVEVKVDAIFKGQENINVILVKLEAADKANELRIVAIETAMSLRK